MPHLYWPKFSFPYALLVLSSSYFALALYFWLYLDFDFLRSDVLWYWKDSLDWRNPFNPYHVPGYPLLIACLRGITLDKLHPAIVMMSLACLGLLFGAAAIYKIILHYQGNARHAFTGTCLYGLWPLVGMTYIVFPHADIIALAFFLCGLSALLQSRLNSAAILLGLSLIIHKVMWPFVVFVMLADCVQYQFRLLRQWQPAVLLGLPLGLLWLLGALHHQSVTWIFASSLSIGTEATNAAPIMPGLIEVLSSGGLKALVKGGYIISLCLLSIGICYYSLREKYLNYAYSIGIAFTCLLLALTMSAEVLWASVRFSRLLILPIFWITESRPQKSLNEKNSLLGLILLVLLLTQFAFAWYMEKIYFGSNLHPFNH